MGNMDGAAVLDAPGYGHIIGFSDKVVSQLIDDIIDEPWGKQWHSRMRHDDYECRDCKWDVTHDPRGQMQAIVGFSRLCPPRRQGKIPAVGCIIIECPTCGKFFWNHVTLNDLKACRKLCPHWPK